MSWFGFLKGSAMPDWVQQYSQAEDQQKDEWGGGQSHQPTYALVDEGGEVADPAFMTSGYDVESNPALDQQHQERELERYQRNLKRHQAQKPGMFSPKDEKQGHKEKAGRYQQKIDAAKEGNYLGGRPMSREGGERIMERMPHPEVEGEDSFQSNQPSWAKEVKR